MSDLFDYFQSDRSLISTKHKLKIFVMGAYYPESVKSRLELLRDHLKNDGYNARTAEDFHTTPKTNEEIFLNCKEYLLNWAHGRIFVFFKEALEKSRILGVYDEFVTATERLPIDEHHTCAIFLENTLENEVSSMMRGRLEYFKDLKVYRFSSDEELHVMASDFCFNLLYQLYSSLEI